MNRLENVFRPGDKAFIPFITAGDPSLAVTEQLIEILAAAGADLIELGIPFSDPVAEGPVIAAADERALRTGVTVQDIFAMVRRVRRRCQVPLALMTYFNPVYCFGTKRFIEACRENGIDAVIVPDLPHEERGEIEPFCRKEKIHRIPMVAPTSQSRITDLVRDASGFVYCVSALGVTGVRDTLSNSISDLIEQVRQVKAIPCAIGFGIATPKQASDMAALADGVIVGSAIVRLIGQHGVHCLKPVETYAREMIRATKSEAAKP